ncbi:TetR/AcrR family transcriptional regulator [Devosia nitrariae]|uniref:TetR family transcriptional regulator n=1 Tax=Devosia nitrariae TaxID=2071872 RepID=A0ABQ5WB85_9HYPH|nr:TetR/AcrR family transcriptional regulator [Devosia nitrariae]GLQ57029.1 TetR family transcriptional regulator [Devosia nitrariae]
MRYEKGRKDASKQRIVEVAAGRFRADGIAATGLASIMSDAGLTNGAFYPHFKSKAALIGASVSAALEQQFEQIDSLLAAGGPEAAISAYLSSQHRDDPGHGCASAALLPEIGRESPETRRAYTESVLALVNRLAGELPLEVKDREGAVLAIFATLIGTLQLARAVDRPELSDQILAAGANAARRLGQSEKGEAVNQL